MSGEGKSAGTIGRLVSELLQGLLSGLQLGLAGGELGAHLAQLGLQRAYATAGGFVLVRRFLGLGRRLLALGLVGGDGPNNVKHPRLPYGCSSWPWRGRA